MLLPGGRAVQPPCVPTPKMRTMKGGGMLTPWSGLRRTKTEIGKWRAETAAVKPAAGGLEFEDCRPETSAWNPNQRKCRSFSEAGKPGHRDPFEPWNGGIKINYFFIQYQRVDLSK